MMEASIVASFLMKVKDLAKKGEPVRAVKVHGGGFTSGQPDVLMCYNGRMVQIEFKQPGAKPTDRQREELSKWEEAGAITMVATDPITPLVRLGLIPETALEIYTSKIKARETNMRDIPVNFDQK